MPDKKAQVKKKKPLVTPSDVLFTVVLVGLALLVWFFALPDTAGDTVVLRQNGVEIARMPLDTDAGLEVVGSYTNIFVVQDGSVYVAYTDCPNHQCEKTGAVSRVGASIVCAPNRASATIEGEGAAVDAATG